MKKIFLITLLVGLALVVTACDSGGPSAEDAVKTVESYLQAKIASDKDGIAANICSDMEANIEQESHTFETVSDAKLQDVSCEFDGESAVNCTGMIVATYGTEDTEFPLRNYSVVEEDGEWKWCGEAS